jgi:hypothetical protein
MRLPILAGFLLPGFLLTGFLLAAASVASAQTSVPQPPAGGAAAPGRPQATSPSQDIMERRPDLDPTQRVTDPVKRELATDPKVLESMNPHPVPQGNRSPNNFGAGNTEVGPAVDRALQNPATLDGTPAGRPSDAARPR